MIDYFLGWDCDSDLGVFVVQTHMYVTMCRGNYLDGGEDKGTAIWTVTAIGAGETMLDDVERLNGGESAVIVSSKETGTKTGALPHVHVHDHDHGHGHPRWRVSE